MASTKKLSPSLTQSSRRKSAATPEGKKTTPMSLSGTKVDHLTELRSKAEELVAAHPGPHTAATQQDLDRLRHEIHVSRIEQEIQNSELLTIREENEKVRQRYEALYNKYANLFELSPNAYVVFDQSGTICEANLNAAIMFNLPKDKLPGCPMARFIHRDDQDTFHLLKQDCHRSSGPHVAELTMLQSGGRDFPAQIQLLLLPRSHQAGNEFRACFLDLTERIRISAHLNFLHQCLEISVKANNTQELLEDYIRQIKQYGGCTAVGIRLLDDSGHIPYQAYDGFSLQFYERESPLSLHRDQCMCIEVIKGCTCRSKPFYTAFGSFYINASSRFLATIPPEERGSTCNACNAAGFESWALIPIYIDRNISGLIHVADLHENHFPLRVVEILEQAAMRLGLALQRIYMQEKLSQAVDDLRDLSTNLLKVRETEQRRIAMELHDQTGQDLNVLKLRLKEIETGLRKDQGPLKQVCAETRAYTNTIIDSIRRLIRDLTPRALETLGVVEGINQVIREFSERTPIHVESHLIALENITDHDTKVGLFRIVQEAMNNTCKYAGASGMCISAIETGRNLHLTIEDNGKGFSQARKPPSKIGPNGMGLQTMQLRARMLGGNMNVQSWPGKGTRITICLPMKNAQEVP